MDLSFISLKSVLPAVWPFLRSRRNPGRPGEAAVRGRKGRGRQGPGRHPGSAVRAGRARGRAGFRARAAAGRRSSSARWTRRSRAPRATGNSCCASAERSQVTVEERPPSAEAMKPIRSLAFVVNAEKPGAVELARVLDRRGAREGRAPEADHPLSRCPRGYLRGCDACCVIGGDGTLLGVVREAAQHERPHHRGQPREPGVPDHLLARGGPPGFRRPPARAPSTSTTAPCSPARVAGGRTGLALNDVADQGRS